MSIPLKKGVDPKPSRVYPLSKKNRQVINKIFNKLYKYRKI